LCHFGNKHEIFTDDSLSSIKKDSIWGHLKKNPRWPPFSRWPPVHNKFLMNCCTTCVCCLTALSCDVYYEGICRIDFFRLVELHHSRKFLACCQNGTIFSPNCWTSAHLPTGHSLFHAHVPLSATEVSLSQDHVCGTLYRLL